MRKTALITLALLAVAVPAMATTTTFNLSTSIVQCGGNAGVIGANLVATNDGGTLEWDFTGTQIECYCYETSGSTETKVWIDGVAQTNPTVGNGSGNIGWATMNSSLLSDARHTIRINATTGGYTFRVQQTDGCRVTGASPSIQTSPWYGPTLLCDSSQFRSYCDTTFNLESRPAYYGFYSSTKTLTAADMTSNMSFEGVIAFRLTSGSYVRIWNASGSSLPALIVPSSPTTFREPATIAGTKWVTLATDLNVSTPTEFWIVGYANQIYAIQTDGAFDQTTPVPSRRRISCIGDSTTESRAPGSDILSIPGRGWPTQLAAQEGVLFYNWGVSGAQVTGAPTAEVLRHLTNVTHMTIMYGINDYGADNSLSSFNSNYVSKLNTLVGGSSGVKIHVLDMFIPSYASNVNSHLTSIVSTVNNPLVTNFHWSGFTWNTANTASGGDTTDGTHQNRSGHQKLATSLSNQLSLQVDTPTIGTATANSSSQVTVTWTDNSSDETGFTIYYNTSNTTSGASTTTAAADATSKAVTGLSGSTTYYFWVKATNSYGASDYSSSSNATTQSAATPDYYVNRTRANDSGDGLSWATAKKTIGAAVVAAGTAGGTKVIGVAPGDYEAESSGRIIFDATASGDTITVQKYAGVDTGGGSFPADSDPTGVCDVGSTNFNAIWFKTDCTAGVFKWKGIDVSTSDTNQMINLDNATDSGTLSITFEDCTLAGYGYAVGVAGTQRDITLKNVTFAIQDGLPAFVSNSARTFTLDHCTLSKVGGADASSPFFQFGSVSSSVLGTLTVTGGSYVNSIKSARAMFSIDNIAAGTFTWDGCTINHSNQHIRITGQTGGTHSPTIKNVTSVLDDTGQTSGQTFPVFLGTQADTATTTMGPCKILNNSFDVKGTGSGNSVVVMQLGPECKNIQIVGNRVRGHTYWNPTLNAPDGKDLGIYLQGAINAHVAHNEIACRGALVNVLGNGMVAHNNTFYSSTGSGSNGAVVFFRDQNSTGVTDTTDLRFFNNIVMAGSDVQYVTSFAPHDSDMDLSSWIMDNNEYWKAGATAASTCFLWKATPKTFAQVQTAWAAESGVGFRNELSSLFSDPLFMSVSAANFKLKSASPARGRFLDSIGSRQFQSGKGQTSFVGDNP